MSSCERFESFEAGEDSDDDPQRDTGGRNPTASPDTGPQRWAEPVSDLRMWWWIGGLGGLGLALMGWSAYGARRRRVAALENEEIAEESPKTPSDRVVRSARAIRELASERLGETYRARTVEEIGESSELEQTLGSDLFAQFLHVLNLADRVKFAGEEANEDQGLEACDAVEACRSAFEGASSRINAR